MQTASQKLSHSSKIKNPALVFAFINKLARYLYKGGSSRSMVITHICIGIWIHRADIKVLGRNWGFSLNRIGPKRNTYKNYETYLLTHTKN